MRAKLSRMALMLALGINCQPAFAIDPLYQPEMERLVTIMGSLYFLDPICNTEERYWRFQAEELILLDQPTEERKQRLIGAFNTGYAAFARTYVSCTQPAIVALDTLLEEADGLTQDIHSRYAE